MNYNILLYIFICIVIIVITLLGYNYYNTEQIYIVYFINTYTNTNFKYLLQSQMEDLLDTNIMDTGAKLYIEVCCFEKDNFLINYLIKRIFPKNYHHNIVISCHNENNHEYYGINRVWELSQKNPINNTLYFHAKGISRNTFSRENNRDKTGSRLFDIVIKPWKKVLSIFNNNPNIDKIGTSFSNVGFIWWNFFWIRGSYCVRLEKPIKTNRRHYYEDWTSRCIKTQPLPEFYLNSERDEVSLGDVNNPNYDYILTWENCYSLLHEDNQIPLSGEQASILH